MTTRSPTASPRDAYLQIRLPSSGLDAFRSACKQADRNMSDVARELIAQWTTRTEN